MNIKKFEQFKDKEYLDIPDIRNKLSPIRTLISLIENGVDLDSDFIKDSIEQCKISINYLSNRDIY
jgi:hypothetical protein